MRRGAEGAMTDWLLTHTWVWVPGGAMLWWVSYRWWVCHATGRPFRVLADADRPTPVIGVVASVGFLIWMIYWSTR